MRDIITLDAETYFDNEYSLRHMTTAEYLLHRKFQILGLGVKANNDQAQFFTGTKEDLREQIKHFPFENSLVVGHNVLFDGSILEWHLRRKPWRYFCTMMGSRPFVAPVTGKMSLDACSKFFGLKAKGDETKRFKGLRLPDLDTEGLLRLMAYCLGDVDISFGIFKKVYQRFSPMELTYLDLTIKKFTRPQLRLNLDRIRTALQYEKQQTCDLIHRSGQTREILFSNVKFAELIENMGYEVPMKASPSNPDKKTFAFAKTDPGLRALREKPGMDVIVDARLRVRSRINETRLERFLGVGRASAVFTQEGQSTLGSLPVPLLYWGAHTGRNSGLDKLNLQNLTRSSELRHVIVAPPGYKILAGDLSQIEARILAVLAECEDLIKQFANGEDVYSNFASQLYGIAINKAEHPTQRFVGKTSILGLGYGLGHAKFLSTMLTASVFMDAQESQRIVDTYRRTFGEIPNLWGDLNNIIRNMVARPTMDQRHGILRFKGHKVFLPNGMWLTYNNLRRNLKTGRITYQRGRETIDLYGGKAVENIVQALAQIVIKEIEVRLYESLQLRAALQIHDELVFVVKEDRVEEVRTAVTNEMVRTVPWMPRLPLACEVAVGDSYGEAK